jgi:putative transposase
MLRLKKAQAATAYDQSIFSYQTKFPKACECLQKDKEVLFAFYDFPAQHWPHLRTTKPIESTFATVRLPTHRTKGSGSRIATLTMVFKFGLRDLCLPAWTHHSGIV